MNHLGLVPLVTRVKWILRVARVFGEGLIVASAGAVAKPYIDVIRVTGAAQGRLVETRDSARAEKLGGVA